MHPTIRWVAALALVTPAAAQQAPRQLMLTKELTLDADAEDFSRINWVAVARDQSLILLAPKGDDRLRFYTPAGKLTGTFLRPGEGPNELRALPAWGWVGDTLWLADPSNRRMIYLGPDHKPIRNTTAPLTVQARPGSKETIPGGASRVPVAVYGNGDYLMITSAPFMDGSAPQVFSRVGANGVLKQQIATAPGPIPTSCRYDHQGPGMTIVMTVIFCAENFVKVSRDGQRLAMVLQNQTVAPGSKASWRLVVVGARGDTLLSRSYDYTAEAVTAADRDSIVAAREKLVQEKASVANTNNLGAARAMPLPRSHPGVAAFVLGNDGTLWLRPGVYERPADGGERWTMLDAKGNSLGTVSVPAGSVIQYASASSLVVIRTDEDGLPSVVKYRVAQN